MIKCLHISANQYTSIDKANYTKNIWEELSKGFDEYHVVARSHFNKFENYQEGKIFLHLVPGLGKRERSFMISSLYIFILIKKYKITHLLAQSSILGGFSAAIASRFFQIPLMVEVHGEQYFRYLNGGKLTDKLLAFISRYSFNSSKKVRSLNTIMTQKLVGAGIKNIVEIPNRVDLNIFNHPKENFQISTPIKLVSVGRFVVEKNYSQLIKNLHELQIDFQLTLIGGGPLQAEYEGYIKKSNISDRVKLITWIEQKDLVDRIINSDIYIQYSISEGMPRTILEAMALRVPIISTDVGSIAGVLHNNINSKIIEVNHINELQDAILELKNNDKLRIRLAIKAYTDVVEKFEWNKCFEKYRSELTSM